MSKLTDPDSFVFMELRANGAARTFPLPPREERAIVVGSVAGADFRVSGLGVAPVQFHLERDGHEVLLIPAYAIADLRVNGARVSGPTPLDEHNVIEFCGVRLDAVVVDAESFADDSDRLATGELDRWDMSASYSLNLPGELDATQVAMPPVQGANDPADEYPTTVFEPVRSDEGGMAPQHTERMAPHRSPAPHAEDALSLPEHTTERMVPLRESQVPQDDTAPTFALHGTAIMAPFRSDASSPANLAPPAISPEPSERSAFDTVRLIPLRNAPRPEPRSWQPSRDSPVKARARELREAAAARVPVALVALGAAPSHAERTSILHAAGHKPPPTATETPRDGAWIPPRSAERIAWLTRLGLMTKARPLVVAAGASVGALTLLMLLLTATHVTQHLHHPVAAQSPRQLTSTLYSMQAVPTAASSMLPEAPTVVETAATGPSGSHAVSQPPSVKQLSSDPLRRKPLY